MKNPFSALSDTTAVISGTTTSAAASLPGTAGGGQSVRVFNSGTTIAFVRWAATSPTAVATDIPIAPGATEVFSLPVDAAFVAAILASGTGSIYFTRGAGS